MRPILLALLLTVQWIATGQTNVTVYPDSLVELVNVNYRPGVFYVPKTDVAATDFLGNAVYFNSVRTHVIESALNNAENLEECLELLESVESILVDISNKCQQFIFIFEKMPAWLSSSDDGSPAMTPGWFVLNTKKPENWSEWQNMVEAVTDKLVTDFGIDNAYFEVWNEPDIGSWTESNANYLELYKYTYDGIKAVGSDLKVGGPAVNFWANNIYWKPVAGHIPNAVADSSLVSELIDYGLAESRLPDFISWHNFNLSYQEFENATAYLNHKCDVLGIPVIESILSEWNAPSVIRDTPLAKSFMVKAQFEISQTPIANNVIAAWQDFAFDTEEFHNDYGLLTYGGIHKPAYNVIKLTNQLRGAACKVLCTDPNVIMSAAEGDTLTLIISNYCPPALQEAINHTLFEGGFNANDLEEAGFIDLETGDFSELVAIYEEESTLPDSSPLNMAVNAAIPIYQFYDSVAVFPRTYSIHLSGYAADYMGWLYKVGNEENNTQFRYDSLIGAGYTQETATEFLLENQQLVKSNYAFMGGMAEITLEPNEVVLFKVGIDGVGLVKEESLHHQFYVYPNPATNELNLVADQENQTYRIYNLQGELMQEIQVSGTTAVADISGLSKGVYIVQDTDFIVAKFIKN